METMYPGITNSPETSLTSDITDVATTIPVAELGIFPVGPNIATIGTGEDAETILYTAKSATSGAGNLTGCTREFDKSGSYGQKLAWLSGSIISRNFSNIDFYAIQTNITDLSTNKISNSLFDANTILAATSDDTPAALTVAASTFVGRKASGNISAMSAAEARTVLNVADGANAYVHPNHSGDVTSAADGATTIIASAVSLAKMADMATASLLGRNTAGTGAPEVLSKTTALALLNVENGADVTDATNVDAAGAVMETDYTAYSVLAADTGSTPLPITIAASTILGRKASGGIVALAPAEVMTILGTFTAAALTRSLILNAYNSLSPDTNPASLDQTELPTNAFPMPKGIFTTAGRGTEQLFWITYMDPQWDEGTVIANVEFTIPTYDASHSVIWEVYAVRVPSGGLMTTALPLLSTITVGSSTYPDYSKILSAETTPLTITGTGNTILWKLKRKLDAADNYAFSAWFNAIKVEYVVS